ncbi:MAG: hypothetical protein HOV79_19020 [Hamadaea sp.]|nr:hypothetical protein [Hamadaea sp.]
MSAKDHGGAALAWLAHPVTVAALAVLLLNDHVLKAAHPGWVTGKLSDVAGLLVAAPLVALVLSAAGRGFRATAGVAVALTGTLFTLVKISGYAAGVASAAWTAVAGTSRVLADPTDLLALPALLLAYHVGMRASRAPAPGRVARTARIWLVLPVALLAVAATSKEDPPDASMAVVYRGEIYVNTSSGYLATADGITWREVDYEFGADLWKEPEFVAHRAGTETSAPYEPGARYRPRSGGLGVERSVDGGPWQTIWSVSDGRREFLARALDAPLEEITTSDVAVHFGRSGRIVVAANRQDGIAVQRGDGPFERIGFPRHDFYVHESQVAGARASGLPTPAPVLDVFQPAPLTGTGREIWPEIFLGLLLATICVVIGKARMSRQTRGRIGGGIFSAMAVSGFLLAWASAVRSSFEALLFGLPAFALVLLGVPYMLLVFSADRTMPIRGRLALLGLAFVAAVAFVAPFLGWSAGIPDDLGAAYVPAAAVTVAAIGAAVWLGGRWRQKHTELTWPGGDPSPPASPPDPTTPDRP